MAAKPVGVKALSRYKIWLKFSDGSEGEADLSHLAGKGVFASWNDNAEFEKVRIDPESGTVCWSSGIDLCPDSLYMQVTGKSVEEVFTGLHSMASNA